MKTYFTLRSTLSNVSWAQRGGAALLVAALLLSIALAWRVNLQSPAAQAPVAIPAPPSVNVPSPDIRAAYDGNRYAEYLAQRLPIVVPPAIAPNPNRPVIGTGSAYDGGSYVTERPAPRNPNHPVIGTGSVYDGGTYVLERPTVRYPYRPPVGIGRAYDGP